MPNLLQRVSLLLGILGPDQSLQKDVWVFYLMMVAVLGRWGLVGYKLAHRRQKWKPRDIFAVLPR